MRPKKTQCHDLMTEEDKRELVDATAPSAYRSAIGVLMYLASKFVECAYTIRGLAQCMSKPTERSWLMLKQCIFWVQGPIHSSCRSNQMDFGTHLKLQMEIVLELLSVSAWATTRSVSACVIFFQGCMLHASSQTQQVVSLSSAEAELHSSVSCVCDVFMLKHCIVFCLDRPIRLKLILDNSAARQVLFRSGVGRIVT